MLENGAIGNSHSLDFEEYIIASEPSKRERAYAWYFRNALVRANYRNVAKGIDYDLNFLIRFFRNLLMDERNELKNRYMLVNPPEEWKLPTSTPSSNPASNRQAPEQAPEQACDLLHTDNPQIRRLVMTIGFNECSISQLMQTLGLKHRPNFLEYHLNPAIKEGFVRMLYPDSPRHPRQKYLLTVKGLALFNKLTNTK